MTGFSMLSVVLQLSVIMALITAVNSLIAPDLSPSQAIVKEGRYEKLVVGINYRMLSNSVSEVEYLEHIKSELSALSKAIHETVGLQFGEVTIVVPSYWNRGTYGTAFDESPESADILIQPLEGVSLVPSLGESPIAYTRHIQPCGMQGLRLVVDARVFKEQRNAQKTKLLLHQWIHLRYGVFDEFPLLNTDAADVDKQKFYHSENSIESVRCSHKLASEISCNITKDSGYTDIDRKTSLPLQSCSYTVKALSNNSASLMSNYQLENVKTICDQNSHNEQAPNRHNRLCNSRSVREVLENHKDFNISGLGKSSIEYATPTFKVKKLRESRTVVFVVDTSNSMAEENRLYLAKQAIEHMIAIVLEDYVKLMIIGFDLNPKRLFPDPTSQETYGVLSSKEARARAIESLSNIQLGGETCIGCGLRLAYEEIEKAAGTVHGANFILLTDGADTKPLKSNVEEMFRRSQLESFFIDTILLSDEADNSLIDLATESGSQIFRAVAYSSSLVDAYTEMVTNRQNITSRMVQIHSKEERVLPENHKAGEFVIERHLNGNSKITFFWNATAQPFLEFEVVRKHNGQTTVEQSTGYTSGQLSISLDNSGISSDESISYTYRIMNTHQKVSFIVTVKVEARPNYDPVTDNKRERRSTEKVTDFYQEYGMEAFVRSENNFSFTSDGKVPEVSIHAYLPPGSTPSPPNMVICTITVNGIETTNTAEYNIILHDNGVGADVIVNDGIYSAFFSQYVSYNATYYVRIRAEGPGFMRYASTGYFVVYMEPGLDVPATIPPATIMDLQAIEFTESNTKLRFTATGADLDYQAASYYKLWYSVNYDEMKYIKDGKPLGAEFKALVNKPKNPGTIEELHIDLPQSMLSMNHTLWLALTAVDEHELESNLSNIISVKNLGLTALDSTPEPTVTINQTPGTIIKGLDNLYFYIIAGGIGLLVLLILVLVICLCCCRKRNDGEKKSDLSSFESSPQAIENGYNLGYEYSLGSDLAEHDTLYMSNTQINTFHKKPLPSTKKRVNSINWSASIKRLTSKKKAPLPPSSPGVPTQLPTVSKVPPVATVKPTQRLSAQYITSQRQNAKPMVVNTENMAIDLAYAADIAKAVVQKDSQQTIDDTCSDVPC